MAGHSGIITEDDDESVSEDNVRRHRYEVRLEQAFQELWAQVSSCGRDFYVPITSTTSNTCSSPKTSRSYRRKILKRRRQRRQRTRTSSSDSSFNDCFIPNINIIRPQCLAVRDDVLVHTFKFRRAQAYTEAAISLVYLSIGDPLPIQQNLESQLCSIITKDIDACHCYVHNCQTFDQDPVADLIRVANQPIPIEPLSPKADEEEN